VGTIGIVDVDDFRPLIEVVDLCTAMASAGLIVSLVELIT
jgi:hypothetical protein